MSKIDNVPEKRKYLQMIKINVSAVDGDILGVCVCVDEWGLLGRYHVTVAAVSVVVVVAVVVIVVVVVVVVVVSGRAFSTSTDKCSFAGISSP